ncbi:MAG: DUF2934 domain-containing protein [Planctomyces sp.]|nr:DUF2934 domain-containing protein [Planctomyces sp.]
MKRTEKKQSNVQGHVSPEHQDVNSSGSATAMTTEQEQVTECLPAAETASDDFDMAIRELAYFKWESAGFPDGDGLEFWLEAERELKGNPQTRSPAAN